MKKLERSFNAKIEGRTLKFANADALRKHLELFNDGEEAVVIVKRRVHRRSLRQNAYYWGVVLPVIAKDTGHTTEELHEIYKRMFLPRQVLRYKDREYPIPGSTTEQDSPEFSEYIERIRAEAATLGIVVPNPNEVDF